MKYISLIFIAFLFFAISCGSDNTVKPNWEGCITDKNCEDGQKCIAGNCTESNTCEKDSDCLNGQFCNDNKLCESYCESNDDCGVGFICNSESKKCEKDPNTHLCEKDSDCKENEICDNYKCTPKEDPKTCSSDAECLNGQHCSNGTCTVNCTEDSCEDGYECNQETKECQKTVCEKDTDCKDGFYCENQECKTKEYECTENTDCFNGYECKDNKCKLINDDSCNAASDCDGPLTIRCMGAHWECIENKCEQKCGAATCETAEDCPGTPYIDCEGAHWECKENLCVAECGNEKCGNNICDSELGEDYKNCPSDCRDDHCDDGTEPLCEIMPPTCNPGEILAYYNNCYACVNPVTCKPIPERCRSNEECGEGFICTEEGVCKAIEPECRVDADCPELPLPINCEGHWECQNSVCTPVCNDFYCGDGTCNEGENRENCPEDCEIPPECRVDADCEDGNACTIDVCNNGMCNSMAVRCPQDMTCNPETGNCEREPYCGNGECEIGEWDSCPEDCQQPECRTDRDCSEGEYCTPEGYCQPNNTGCQTDADCNDGEVCTNGQCAPGICIPGIIECPEGYTCENNTCVATGAVCGNQICESGENSDNCPEDCGVTPVCEPDQFEDNDDIGNPARVSYGNYDNLTITYEDEDWYSFDYDGQTTLEIKFNFINANGDIDVYAFQDGEQIISSEGYTNEEILVISPDRFRAGEVLINVALIQNPNEPYHECQTYSVKTGINPNACVSDQFEPNNSRRESTRLQLENNSADYDLTLCDSDTDWFIIQMNTYTQLRVQTDLTFKTELYVRGTRDPIAVSATSADGYEVLTFTNNDDNARSIDVMLKVFKDEITIDNASYDYNLNINIYEIDY